MADYYALEFVGGPDGTQQPPKKLDGRVVGAKKRRTRASKPATIPNVGDRMAPGKLPQGAVLQSIIGNVDTSLGTATLSVGTTANPTKYVNAKTLTATDTPTSLGPKASAAVLAPATVDEDLWLTVGVAAIPANVVAAFFTEYTIAN
ncbi:hypothetical protein [Sphingomonas sp.]|uniref:hypothetical protein n=1 Tax=Sphingomonas sp. TaxID=28214 RepID=UPI00257DB416|nr:hypothetical protein [Sphingomonas sp.]